MRTYPILTVLLFFIASYVISCKKKESDFPGNYSFSGVVSDVKNDSALAGVMVRLSILSTDTFFTDSLGRFSLSGHAEREPKVQFMHDSYRSQWVEITDSEPVDYSVRLEPLTPAIIEVERKHGGAWLQFEGFPVLTNERPPLLSGTYHKLEGKVAIEEPLVFSWKRGGNGSVTMHDTTASATRGDTLKLRINY